MSGVIIKWCVFTPAYGEQYSYGSDTTEVQAHSRREALVIGLRVLRALGSRWIQDQQSDGRNPFNGLKAEPLE